MNTPGNQSSSLQFLNIIVVTSLQNVGRVQAVCIETKLTCRNYSFITIYSVRTNGYIMFASYLLMKYYLFGPDTLDVVVIDCF